MTGLSNMFQYNIYVLIKYFKQEERNIKLSPRKTKLVNGF